MSWWNHAICSTCWHGANPNREPVRVNRPPFEYCCFCAKPTMAGIYVRHDAQELACQGMTGRVHEQDEED